MKKIINYTTLREKHLFQLNDKVRDCIEKGWQPIGGVSGSYNNVLEETIFAQAIVKYELEVDKKN